MRETSEVPGKGVPGDTKSKVGIHPVKRKLKNGDWAKWVDFPAVPPDWRLSAQVDGSCRRRETLSASDLVLAPAFRRW
jgi:hypothetical protein